MNKDIVIHKSDKGNSVVIVDRVDYVKKLQEMVDDQSKFKKINVKADKDYNFMVKEKSTIDTVLLELLKNNSINQHQKQQTQHACMVLQRSTNHWLMVYPGTGRLFRKLGHRHTSLQSSFFRSFNHTPSTSTLSETPSTLFRYSIQRTTVLLGQVSMWTPYSPIYLLMGRLILLHRRYMRTWVK